MIVCKEAAAIEEATMYRRRRRELIDPARARRLAAKVRILSIMVKISSYYTTIDKAPPKAYWEGQAAIT